LPFGSSAYQQTSAVLLHCKKNICTCYLLYRLQQFNEVDKSEQVFLFSERLRGKIVAMKEQNPLQTELEYYQKNKQEYLKLYKGQFVLIKGEDFAGAFTTDAEAYKAGLEKFGNEPFLIKQVLDDDGTVSYPALTIGAFSFAL